MEMRTTGIIFFALVFLLLSKAALAVDPGLDWRTLQTPHFNIHFSAGEEKLAVDVAEIAERVHQRLSRELEWQPRGRTEVVLSDESGLPNGMASVIPFDRMLLYPVIPDDIQGLEDSNDWLEMLFLHEYAHVLHLDRASGAPAALRRFFGRGFLLFPNLFQPAWIAEGVATYIETDYQGGYGRGQSAYYRMLMRMEVARGLKPLRQINLPLRSWPGGTANYLYGVYFFRYLEQNHGAQAINGWIGEYSNNLIPFRIYSNPRRYFGRDLDQLWQGFERYLKEEFEPQLEGLRSAGLVMGEVVAAQGDYGGMARAVADGSVYFIHDDGYRQPRLMQWKNGRQIALVELRKQARLDVHEQAGVLITQPEICDEYNIYYDLYHYQVDTGRLRRLSHCERIHWASWSPDGQSIVAVKVTLDGPQLLLLDSAGRPVRQLWQGGRDEQISLPDWSPDGRSIMAAWWRQREGWSLRRFDLQLASWQTLVADGSVVGQPQYTPDGRHVLFISDHEGVYNLRRMDLQSGAVTTLTRVEGGAFHPSQGSDDGAIYYLNFGVDGQQLYRLDVPLSMPLPVSVSETKVQPAVETEQQETMFSSYSPWSSLRPRSWFPHLVMSPEVTELGISTSGQDALGIHSYLLSVYGYMVGSNTGPLPNVSGEVDAGGLLGMLAYRYSNRFSLVASRYNNYDQNDDAELMRIRQQDFLQAEVSFPFIRMDYFWNLKLGAVTEWERDIWRAEPVNKEPATRDNLLGGMLLFDNSRLFTHSISRSDGRRFNLVLENSDVLGGDYSGNIAVADWREYMPLGGQHVMALRMALGWGSDQPKPFRLGGEAGEGLDEITVSGPRLNRRDFALRGYSAGLAGLRGRRMQLASLEWRFPLKRVERTWKSLPAGLQQWSGKLFIDSGAAWEQGSSPDSYFTGAGVELLSDFNLFYLMNLRLRIGYAHGFDTGGDDRFYLNLGNSF